MCAGELCGVLTQMLQLRAYTFLIGRQTERFVDIIIAIAKKSKKRCEAVKIKIVSGFDPVPRYYW